MSAVSSTYIPMAEEGIQISQIIAYSVGIAFARACTVLFAVKASSRKTQQLRRQQALKN